MSSKIDPSGINPSYPVASTNQSSQGFRDNFKAIQNALVQAKTENTLILGTTITVTGDGITPFTSTSIQVGNGNIPLEINLGSQGGVSVGSYDTLTDIIKLSVNANGIVTAISKDAALPTVDTSSIWSVTRCPDDSSFPGHNGVSSFTYPTFTTNAGGRVTGSASVTVSGLGLLGYSMNKGQLLVGSSSNLSTFLAAGSDNQVLVASSGSPTGLAWSTPTTGTVTGVSAGLGLTVASGSSTPEIDLNIPALPDNNTFDSTLIFLTYDNGNHSTTKWSNMFGQVTSAINTAVNGQGFLKHVKDDPTPVLGGTLDANGNTITDSTGTLQLSSSAGKQVAISSDTGITISSPDTVVNGYTFPTTIPVKTGMFMTSDTSGNLSWIDSGSLTSSVQSADSSLAVNQSGSVYTVQYTPWNIPLLGSSSASTYQIVITDPTNKNVKLAPASALFSAENSIKNMTFVSNTGSDSNQGTIFNPFLTITKAISSAVSGTTIMILPGSYSENVTVNKSSMSFVGFGDSVSTTLTGSWTINDSLSYTTFNNLTFGGPTTFTIGAGVRDLRVNNCTFTASGTIINATSTSGSGDITISNCIGSGSVNIASPNISLVFDNNVGSLGNGFSVSVTGDALIKSSSYLSGITHNGGVCEILEVSDLGGLTSTASNNDTDTLVVRNSSLSNNDGTWNALNKSGSCDYILQNVDRLASQDTLNGTRVSFANTDDDIGDQAEYITATGNISLDGKTRVYDVTVNTASAFTITPATDSFDGSKYIRSMTVILRGTSTSAGFGSNTITWSGLLGQAETSRVGIIITAK